MKATITLDGIWTFLQSLSLNNDNKRWLADKLLTDITSDKVNTQEELDDIRFRSLSGCWADSFEMDNVESLISQSRTQGVTRHILSLDDEGGQD